MTRAEADLFLDASHRRLEFARDNGEILVDNMRWIVGFVRGAPYVNSGTNSSDVPVTN